MNKNINQIISSYCLGNISSQDLIVLNEWFKEDPNNKKLFKQYYSSYKKYRSLGLAQNIDVDKAWDDIRGKTLKRRRVHLYKLLPYAAAILLPIAIGFFVYFMAYNPQKSDHFIMSKAPIIYPGTQNATLYLADGKSVNLKENLSIKEKDGTFITRNSEYVSYQENSEDSIENKKNERVYNTLYVPRKGEMQLQLSDGTMVWLNSETTLVYPTVFEIDKREVLLSCGEAYFEVVKDAERPFYVKINGASIKVLGTSFNVKAYKNEDKIETTLVSGKVKLTNESYLQSSSIALEPGKQAVITRGSKDILVSDVDVRLFTSWKDGLFTFENLSLNEIMTIFARWYDLEVFYDDASMKNLHFTGNLKRYKNINPHLEIISKSTNVNFKLTEEAIIVSRR